MKKRISILLALLLFAAALGCAAKQTEPETASALSSAFDGRTDIAYVMVYNPKISGTASSGSIGSQVNTAIARADELENLEPKLKLYEQPNLNDLLDGSTIDAIRTGGLVPAYVRGDEHSFFYGDEKRSLGTFDCLYEGAHCYVWAMNGSISESDATALGREFDDVIYQKDVELFGTPRYAEEGGKITILCYPMADELTGGFFMPYELFNHEELSEEDAAYLTANGINMDHAIIHLNTKMMGDDRETLMGIAAHEFQHLICQTDTFFVKDLQGIGLWLNEGMSCYASEALYPSFEMRCGHCSEAYTSDLISHGHSLYRFYQPNEMNPDIGSYAASFIFASYLANADDGVFEKVHAYWRANGDGVPTDAEAVISAVPADFVSCVSDKYVYPESLHFASSAEESLSKLTLDCYIRFFSDPESISDSFRAFFEYCSSEYGITRSDIVPFLLYDEVNPASIEGGGRIIFATKNGTFTIPDDADPGLVYIGFDSEFRPVTGLIAD